MDSPRRSWKSYYTNAVLTLNGEREIKKVRLKQLKLLQL